MIRMGKLMTREDQSKVAFYQGNGVHSVLKRFVFSTIEKDIIILAIATASKKHPDMKQINKADALLRLVNSTRIPVVKSGEEKETELKSALAEVVFSSTKANLKNSPEERRSKVIIYYLTAFFIMGLLIGEVTKSQQADWYVYEYEKQSYSDAQKQCSHRSEKIPTVALINEVYEQYNVFQKASMYFENKVYWVNEKSKPMIYKVRDTYAQEASSDESHYVMCLDNTNLFF